MDNSGKSLSGFVNTSRVIQDVEISQSNLIQLAYGNGNAYVVDEIRLGSTYAEVTPSLTSTPSAPTTVPSAATVIAHEHLTLKPKSGPSIRIDRTLNDHWTREDEVWHQDRRQIASEKRMKLKAAVRTAAKWK